MLAVHCIYLLLLYFVRPVYYVVVGFQTASDELPYCVVRLITTSVVLMRMYAHFIFLRGDVKKKKQFIIIFLNFFQKIIAIYEGEYKNRSFLKEKKKLFVFKCV